MDANVLNALRTNPVIDITTTGRTSGQPRRIEIRITELQRGFTISGRPGRLRSWYANLRAHPDFTVHVKNGATADLLAHATPITGPAERRAIFTEMAGDPGRAGMDVEEWLKVSPLVLVEFI